MASAKEKKSRSKPAGSFPVPLKEFLATADMQPESRSGFRAQLASSGMATGKRTRAEWQKLFELFKTRPTSIDWGKWVASKGGK